MSSFKTLFDIIKWKYLLYFSFLIFLTKYGFLSGFGYETALSFLDISIFNLSCLFLYSSIYLLTYYFYNNNSKKTTSTVNKIKYIGFSFILIAFLLGVFLSFKTLNPYFSFIFLFSGILSYLYSKNIKEKTFISTLIKAFILPFTVLCIWWLDAPVNLTPLQWKVFLNLQFISVIYLALSFLGTTTEELLKNISNVNEDNLNKLKTLPVLLGRKRAKYITLSIMTFSSFLILFLAFRYFNIKYLFIIIIVSNLFPQLYMFNVLLKAKTKNDYLSILKTIKYLHVVGILGVLGIVYYFKYVVQ